MPLSSLREGTGSKEKHHVKKDRSDVIFFLFVLVPLSFFLCLVIVPCVSHYMPFSLHTHTLCAFLPFVLRTVACEKEGMEEEEGEALHVAGIV